MAIKKYGAALVGVLVLGGFGYGAWYMRGNGGKLPWEAKGLAGVLSAAQVTLPKGTPIELILLEGIDAGGTKEGALVEMGVLKDVKVSGKIVIPMGAKATGEVTKSRGASLLGAVTNKPARLEMTLKSVVLADGREIEIRDQDEDLVYVFTQENTAERLDAAKIDNLWNDSGARNSLTKIAQGALEGKDLGDQSAEVQNLAERLGLEKAKDLSTEPGKEVTMERVLQAMADNDAGGVDGVQAVLLAQAVGEVSDMVSSVDHKLRGVFKGRTIRATIGTPVMVWTVRDEVF